MWGHVNPVGGRSSGVAEGERRICEAAIKTGDDMGDGIG